MFDDFRECLEALIVRRTSEALGETLPQTTWYRLNEDAHTSIRPVQCVDWQRATSAISFDDWPEMDAVRRAVEGNPNLDAWFREMPSILVNGQPLGGPLDQQIYRVVSAFNVRLIERNAQRFDATAFDYFYDELIAEITSPSIIVKATCYMLDTRLVKDVDLGDDESLRVVPRTEAERSCNAGDGLFSAPDPELWSRIWSAIEIKRVIQTGLMQRPVGNDNELLAALESLRGVIRLNRSDIRFAFSRVQKVSVVSTGSLTQHLFASRNWRSVLPDVTSQQLADMRSACLSYRQSANRPLLTAMLRRYNFGLDRIVRDDSIVDFMVAIESALGEPGETTYKTCIRLAAVIGSTAGERSNVFSQCKEVYKIRSSIVHGDTVKHDKLSKAFDTALDFVKRLIVQVLAFREEFKAKNVDQLLLAGFGSYSAADTAFLRQHSSPCADAAPDVPSP